MFCANCGTHLPDTAKFCIGCGRSVVVLSPRETRPRTVDLSKRRTGKKWSNAIVIGFIPGMLLLFVVVSFFTDSGGDRPTKSGPSTSQTQSSIVQWYEGGTLHSTSVADWRAANYRNRLATSADFAMTALNRKGVTLSSMSELRPKAQALEICVSEAAKPPTAGTLRIVELATQCVILIMDSQ